MKLKKGDCVGDVTTMDNNNSFELPIKYIKPLFIMTLPTAKQRSVSSGVVNRPSNPFSTNQWLLTLSQSSLRATKNVNIQK